MATAAARTVTATDNQKPLITEAELRDEFKHVEPKLKEIEDAAALVPTLFEDDEDLTAAQEMAPKLRGALKGLENYRKERKKPFDDGGDLVQAFFKSLSRRVTDIQTRLETSATNYLRKKDAAEKARQRQVEADQRAESARLASEAATQAAAGNLKEAVTTQAASEAATTRAEQASTMVDARPAERARTTTAAGTATLIDKYEFKITDVTKIDAFKLIGYFTPTEINAAITRAVSAGVRELAGVEIFPAPKARL